MFIQGQQVDRLPPNRRPVNTVFQRYALFPHKTVLNVAFSLTLKHVPRAEQQERVAEMLRLAASPASKTAPRRNCQAGRPSASRWPGR